MNNKTKITPGRPRKGDKPRRAITVYLEDEAINKIDHECDKRKEQEPGYSRGDFITEILKR